MNKKIVSEMLQIKYESMLEALLVMDDYDGGRAEMLRTVIEDLKVVNGTIDLNVLGMLNDTKMEFDTFKELQHNEYRTVDDAGVDLATGKFVG